MVQPQHVELVTRHAPLGRPRVCYLRMLTLGLQYGVVVKLSRRIHVDHERMVAGLIEAFGAARIRRDPMAMIAAMREIGKLCGFYPEKEPRRGRWQPGENLKAMSNEELLAMLDDDGGHQGCSSAAA